MKQMIRAKTNQASAVEPASPGRWGCPLQGEAPKALRGWE